MPEVVISDYHLRSKSRKIALGSSSDAAPGQDQESPQAYKFGKTVTTDALLNMHIDDGPQKPRESKWMWAKRVMFARRFMGVKGSDLREARRAVLVPTAHPTLEVESYTAQMRERMLAIKQCQKHITSHEHKMDPGHKHYDVLYAKQYRADKAVRVKDNAQKREGALQEARTFAKQNGLKRPSTPLDPDDSSDEELPQQLNHLRSKSRLAQGAARPLVTCKECFFGKRACSNLKGFPKPCGRCVAKGLSCEDRVDLELESYSILNAGMEVDAMLEQPSEQIVDTEMVTGMEPSTPTNSSSSGRDSPDLETKLQENFAYLHEFPMELPPCSLCQNNRQICDGLRPCASCIQHDVAHLCAAGDPALEVPEPVTITICEDYMWATYRATFEEYDWTDHEQMFMQYMSKNTDDAMFKEFVDLANEDSDDAMDE
jgi:hypothetical protein